MGALLEIISGERSLFGVPGKGFPIDRQKGVSVLGRECPGDERLLLGRGERQRAPELPEVAEGDKPEFSGLLFSVGINCLDPQLDWTAVAIGEGDPKLVAERGGRSAFCDREGPSVGS